jgi:2-aminophenol/2-amino-5-chlorophenol 1,6-dioxygenase subunit alpha
MAVADQIVTPGERERAAFRGAAIVPGMPQLLAGDQARSWRELADATRRTGEDLRAARPDVLVVLSTQWFTVLGHQVQLDPNPHGTRVDENWYAYDYGTLEYDLAVDVPFSEAWADEIDAGGLQARRTRYDGFPIDTGVITARPLLDPDATLPIAQVSTNLYAQPDDLSLLGAAALRAAARTGRTCAFVAISGLSSGLIQRWIEPAEDRFESEAEDRWNRRMLDLLAAGKVTEALEASPQFAREAQADSQFRALAFLAGTGCLDGPADVRAYGPVWGTGNAVVHWPHRQEHNA